MGGFQNPVINLRETSLSDLRKLAARGYLYAVIDACNVPTAPKKAVEFGEKRAISLYRGGAEEGFWDVAPYLVHLDGVALDWVLAESSVEGWGIFLASKAELATLRHHLRHFLKVQSPDGSIWFFRFYDPRVLKLFVLGCSRDELRTFFGPVMAFGISWRDTGIFEFYRATTNLSDAGLASAYQFMFRIRPEHLLSLQPVIEADFVHRLMLHLRQEHASVVENLTNPDLKQRISIGLSRARLYGMSTEVNLATFVGLMFEIAPEFDLQLEINRVLSDREESDADVRMNALLRLTSEADWDEAEKLQSPRAWDGLLANGRR